MPREQKISGFGWTMILGAVYLLSPFQSCGRSPIYGGFLNIQGTIGDFVMAFYFPIILASIVSHPIMELYVWRFRQLGVM